MLLAAYRRPALTRLSLLFGLTCLQGGAIEPPLPPEASFLPDVMRLHIRYDAWNEMPFPRYGGTRYSGRHWGIEGSFGGTVDAVSAWRTLKAAFLSNGWTLANEFPDSKELQATLHFTRNRVEVWANVEIVHSDDVRIELLEPSQLPYTLSLPVPKSRAERVDAAKGDFPYAIPLPGSELRGSKSEEAAFVVTLAGAAQPELISTESIVKSYSQPAGVSSAMFAIEYRTALAKAGWRIANESSEPDAWIVAHYSNGRRNLWARFRWNHDGYQIQVAEPATENLARALSFSCHVALYGVLFDFGKPSRYPSPLLTLSPSESNGAPGDTTTHTATTTISVPGSFYWQMVRTDETDDPSAFTLTTSSCAGETTCTAGVRLDHPGFADLAVSFRPANTTQIMPADSAPVLRQVLALLKRRPQLQVEIQGHTDDVGTDAYSRMLSDSQAAAVVTWLTQNGIAAKRLISKGYGRAKPIADNSTDLGRAMNHRIEIADRRCTSKDR